MHNIQLLLRNESILGYSQKQTGKILTQIMSENPGINVETLIKKALNKL